MKVLESFAKGITYVTGGVNPAAKVLNAVGGITCLDRLQDTVRKGDRFGAYNAGAMLVPGMGPYSAGLKLGAIGLDALRQHRAMKAYKEKMKKKSEEPKEPLKPTHGSFRGLHEGSDMLKTVTVIDNPPSIR